ncbi:ATP-binding cassette domain-containing protein [uncultured Roseobacter sp.]|uniref:thiamine ABC transporter ATP-binding protein n=1 Tax=uncultured Roseobacter sp. TaxID=114847 RepID=UPI00262A1AB3|nr:ATP-binding cassette domain-containing protein [uncultured Roseobacter sp.]
MLTFKHVQIGQGDFRLAAHLTVRKGRRVAVIGPSGAGKSTLLGAVGGFVPLISGALSIDGQDVTDARPGARPVSMLFQDNNLFPHLTIAQNAGLGLRPALRLNDDETARLSHALERVGLAGLQNRRPGELSGGQQSRAALARILVQNRPVVLLDEPFAALGPALRREMLDLVRALATETGATLMMVTHAPEDVQRIADDVIFVEGGQAQAPEPAAALMDNPPPALRAYLG